MTMACLLSAIPFPAADRIHFISRKAVFSNRFAALDVAGLTQPLWNAPMRRFHPLGRK
jgi:hypothetical protein